MVRFQNKLGLFLASYCLGHCLCHVIEGRKGKGKVGFACDVTGVGGGAKRDGLLLLSSHLRV